MPGTAMVEQPHAEKEADGNVAVANILLDRMQESGARDHIKEWLFEALEDCGWTSELNRRAAQFVVERTDSNELQADGDVPQSAVPTVAEITEDLVKQGFEAVPSDIRERLVEELLDVVKSVNDGSTDGTQ